MNLPAKNLTFTVGFLSESATTPSSTKKVKQKPRLRQDFTIAFTVLLLNLHERFSKLNLFLPSTLSAASSFSARGCSRNRWNIIGILSVMILLFSYNLFIARADARVAKHVRVMGDVMLYGLFPIHQQQQAPATRSTARTPTQTSSPNQNDDQQLAQAVSEDYSADYGSTTNSSSTRPGAADGNDDEQHNDADYASTCDSLDFVGVYLLEAALFAIDRAAAIMPEGVTLGADFADTCTSSEVALHRARHYAQQARAHNAEKTSALSGHEPLGLGVVGPAHDNVLERSAELLSQYNVPQIAYWATTPSFADKSRFPYMFRSIPDARYEATAVLDLLKQMGWNIVHIVYAQDGFYRSLAVELDRMAAARQICVGSLLPGPSEAEFKEDENNRIAMRVVRSATKNKLDVNVVLWLGKAWDLQYVLRAMNETSLKGKIQLVGLSAWGDDRASLNDYQHLAEGALTLKMPTPAPLDFQAYFSYLKPTINPRNPWFIEFWETYFRCQFVQRDPTFIKEGYQICTNNEEYSPILDYDLDESAANYVIDAVLAFAHAFRAMHFDKCRTFPGICPLMRPFNLTEFTFNYLRNVSFDTLTPFASIAASSSAASASAALTPPSPYVPFSFHYGSNDRAEAHFQILNFQRDLPASSTAARSAALPRARYKLEHVGNWYSRAAVRHQNHTKHYHQPFSSQQNELRGRIFLDRSRLQTLGVQPIVCQHGCQTCSEFVRPKIEPRPSSKPLPPPTMSGPSNNNGKPKTAQVLAPDATNSNQSVPSQKQQPAELDDADDYGGANDGGVRRLKLTSTVIEWWLAFTVILFLLFRA